MSRQNYIYIIVGGIGSGKTSNTKRIVIKLMDNNKSIDKLVVFDDGDYDNWEDMACHHHPDRGNVKLPIIDEKDLLRLKSGHVRVIQKNEDYTTYIDKFSKLRNAAIVIEDASRWIEAESKVPKQIKKLFLNVKQRNVELFFTFHDLQDVPSWFARKARVLILHKTGETEVPKKLDKQTDDQVIFLYNHYNEKYAKDYPTLTKLISNEWSDWGGVYKKAVSRLQGLGLK